MRKTKQPTSLPRKFYLILASLCFFTCFFTLFQTFFFNRRGGNENNNYLLDSNKPTQVNIDVASPDDLKWHKYLTERLTEIKPGRFRCNRYYPYQGVDLMSLDSIYSLCQFENICLNTKGKFVLHQVKERLYDHGEGNLLQNLNSKSFVNTQARLQANRGNFYVNIIDSDIIVKYSDKKEESDWSTGKKIKNSLDYMKYIETTDNDRQIEKAVLVNDRFTTFNCTVEQAVENKCFEGLSEPLSITSNFTFIKEPVYVITRFEAGNLRNLFHLHVNQITNLMMTLNSNTFKDDINNLLDNYILFLDDVNDNEISRGSYSSSLVDDLSIQVMQLLSNRPVLQVCRGEDGNHFISKAPCRNAPLKESENSKLEVCFNSLFAGHALDGIHLAYSREGTYPLFRDLVYSKLKLPETNGQYLREKEEIRVVVQKSSNVAGSIVNVDQVVDYIKGHLSKESFIVNSPELKTKEIVVSAIEVEAMRVEEMVRYFSEVDVFIADQNPSSSIAMLMREGSYVIQSPLILNQQDIDRAFTQILTAVPNVNIYSAIDLEQALIIKEEAVPKVVWPPENLYRVVLKFLRARYSNFIAR
ncbi:hypothetical protein ABK040_014944 [Willaertia magna]